MQQNSPKIFHDFKKLFRLFEDGTVFCAFDTETSGLSYITDNVIEIGAVKFDKNGIIDRYSSFIRINFPLSPKITEITGIKDEMLCTAPDIKTVLEKFLEFSDGTVLVAHNASFDWYFVNQELARNGLGELKNEIIDTLEAARWAYPANGRYSLQYLAAGMKINVESAHRAYDDARVCMEVLQRILHDTMSIQKKD